MKCTFTKHHHSKVGFKLVVAVILLFFVVPAAAQSVSHEVPPLRDRLFYGGGLSLQFGTITDIEVSPVIGVWVLPRLGIAAGPDYTFYKDPNVRTDIYGGTVYAQFVVIQDLNNLIKVGLHYGLFGMIEDEMLSLQSSAWLTTPSAYKRFTVNTLLAGGGISQPLGRRSSINFMLLWPITSQEFNIYGNPEFRVSFIF